MKISYIEINNCCNSLHSLATGLRDNFNEIGQTEQTIHNNSLWQGPGSDHYHEKFTKLLTNFDEAFVEIESSILYLANVSEGYQMIDKQIINEICSNLNIAEPTLELSNIYKGV